MRILHIIGGGDTGGAKTHVLNLLAGLQSHVEVQLVCFYRGELSEQARAMGIAVEVIESKNPLAGARQLKALMEGRTVDVIHCHGARGNMMGWMVRRHFKAPLITTVHSDYRLDYLGRTGARLTYGQINKLALRKMDYYIGVSDCMSETLIDRGFAPEKVYTIYNGIDFAKTTTFADKTQFLQKYGVTVDPSDILGGIVARLSPVKDIATLLRALQRARQDNPRLKLLIAGDGEDLEALKALATSLHISDSVFFLGWIDDVDSFFNAIDINLLTSLSETFPYALTEGARMRKPTIASRVGGIPMLIESGRNGLLFPAGDAAALAKWLVQLSGDDALRELYGQRLYEKARDCYSVERTVQVQLDIYSSLLERERRHKQNKRDGVVICGAYGVGNAGDNAILEAVLASLRELDTELPVTVLAKRTGEVKRQHRKKAIRTLNLFGIIGALRRSRVYINGGGSLMQNATSQRSLLYYLSTLKLAKWLGNRVVMYGCGIGPVSGRFSNGLVRRVLNKSVDTITVRDDGSRQALARMGVDKPCIVASADPALTVQPCADEVAEHLAADLGMEPGQRYIAFLLRSWEDFDGKAGEIAQAAETACRRWGLTPVFVPINSKSDTEAAAAVTGALKTPFLSLTEPVDTSLLVGLLAKMELVVSVRLHGLIFAAISGRSLVGISYDPKVDFFLEYLGYGHCLALRDLTAEGLVAEIEAIVTAGDSTEARLQQTMRLRKLERHNAEAVKSLLELS